ncbi:pyocin activator PrtN family protein [Massilia sp. Root335]|uniref:pyocin activator PrtN family protein n=1 Tax=Massilia sp. Root335 TaxID=1736517 RepID=UPI0009E99CF8|nr:pyocin activator PrtN family protein [Massilia sp. Root335]
MNSHVYYGLKFGKLIITLTEAAAELGLEVGTAHNQIGAGIFPLPTRKMGKNRVVDVRDLADYVDQQRSLAKQIFAR